MKSKLLLGSQHVNRTASQGSGLPTVYSGLADVGQPGEADAGPSPGSLPAAPRTAAGVKPR